MDAQEEWNKSLGQGRSKSYATAWRNAQQGAEMSRIIDGLFPQAYVSVLYDEARATVSTSERVAPHLLQQLRAAGITVAEVGLKGHFHSPNSETNFNTDLLVELCHRIPGLKFPDAASLAMPSYTNNTNGTPITSDAGSMHEIAIRSILVQQCNWYKTFAAVQASPSKTGRNALVVSFGPGRCVPPSLTRRPGAGLVHFADPSEDTTQFSASVLDPEAHLQQQYHHQDIHEAAQQPNDFNIPRLEDDTVVVVGMSIKVAGADDHNEFSQMLQTGESQHELIGPDRLMCDTLFREGDKDPSRKWYGNFIRDPDAFDHRFFKRSPRESSTMDPQQRLFLQAAYQYVCFP